jgi:2-haloacid dehalogenase
MEPTMKLADFRALTFDCYGTLIDWEAGIRSHLEPWAAKHGIAKNGDELLSLYARVEKGVETANPRMLYPEILANTLMAMAKELGKGADETAAKAFGASVGDWPAFPDSADALAYLKRHYKLVILSNVDDASVKRSAARLGNHFDDIVTAQQVGSYKPNLRNFEVLIERVGKLGVPKSGILHTAQSLGVDHVPVNAIGLSSAWIDRGRTTAGVGATVTVEKMPHYDFRFPTLQAMADAHKAGVA